MLLLLTLPAALAGSTWLSFGDVGFAPARQDAPARGPVELAAGPDGLAALYDPVEREVVVLRHGAVAAAFAVDRATDLVFTETSELLVLDDPGRAVQRWTIDGDLVATWPLPDLVPQGGQLGLVGSEVSKVDLFGNHHRVARLTARGFDESAAPALRPAAAPVTWEPATRTVRWSDGELPVPDALKASVQAFGDWLLIEAVVADRPLRVRREAVHRGTGARALLPLEARPYVPDGDVAVSPEGTLLVLVPHARGVELREVTP